MKTISISEVFWHVTVVCPFSLLPAINMQFITFTLLRGQATFCIKILGQGVLMFASMFTLGLN